MSKDELSRVEQVLLKDALGAPHGVSVSRVVVLMGISVRDAMSAFVELRKRGFLAAKGSTIYVTERGRKWVMANQDLFIFKDTKSWRSVPDRFSSSKIRPYEPYSPRISKLSKSFFPIGD